MRSALLVLVSLLIFPLAQAKASGHLMAYSSWSYEWKFPHIQPDESHLDGFGVGNGRVFSLAGTRFPLNTLHNTLGPKFGLPGAFFGDSALTLAIHGETIPFYREWIGHVRRAPVVVTRERASYGGFLFFGRKKAELQVEDYALPDLPVIIRRFEVRNTGKHSIQGLELQGMQWGGLERHDGLLWQERGRARMAILPPGELSHFESRDTDRFHDVPYVGDSILQKLELRKGPPRKLSLWRVKLPEIAPGATVSGAVYLVFADQADVPAVVEHVLDQARAIPAESWRDQVVARWRDWFDQGLQIEVPDLRVQDLFDEVALAIKLQQEPEGGVSPLSRYTKSWLRDTVGPLRYYLALGRAPEALRMANYLYRASVQLGHISNSYPNSLPLQGDEVPVDPGLDWWRTHPFMPGRKAIEAPSYLTLEMYQYWLWTGDIEPIRKRYDFLKWSLLGQLGSKNALGMLPMSGDETWRTDMVLMSLQSALDFAIHHDENRLSVESHFLLTAGAQAMQRMALVLGHMDDARLFGEIAQDTRTVADERFWDSKHGYYVPFYIQKNSGRLRAAAHPLAHVQYMALWSGFIDPARDSQLARGRANMEATLGLLNLHRDGIPNTPSFLGETGEIYTGMEPGLLLWNLTELEHPNEELAFNHLVDVATDSGNYFEFYHRQGDRSARLLNDPYGKLGNSTSLYRPWEGGINLEAAFHYLFGVTPDIPAGTVRIRPHLPDGWEHIEAKGIRIGAGELGLEYQSWNQALELDLSATGASMLSAQLEFPLSGDFALRGPRSVTLDGQEVPYTLTPGWEGGPRILKLSSKVPLKEGATRVLVQF